MGTGDRTVDLSTEGAFRPAEPTWDDQPRGSAWRVLRGALIVALVVFMGVGAVVGDRPSTFSQLEAEVAAGEVDTVYVTGGLPRGATGYSVVEVQWRRGWFRYRAEVVEARPLRRGRQARSGSDVPVLRDAEVRLREFRPDLAVVPVPRVGSSATILGWQLPGWMGWAVFVLGLATLTLLVGGPRPWRATRWAWFWLCFLVLPVGVAAFLLLGGPSRIVPPPRAGAGRLKAGWAFLLAIFLSAALTPDM
ncbi:MAG TPA: hypothetical protein VFZ64_15470 [Nocardioidaceae bacterium]